MAHPSTINGTATFDSWRNRASTVLLALTVLLAVVGGPLLYISFVIEDEDRFVELANDVFDQPDVRAAVAKQVTEITFTAIAADELVADVLPDEARSFAAPVTRFATNQVTTLAFEALDTDVAVRARSAALREVHRQIIEEDAESVTVDLRAVIVRTAREFGGPSIGGAVAKVASSQDVGRYEVGAPGSGTARIVSVVRSLPGIGAAISLATLAALMVAIAVAEDRRRALMLGGLCLATGAVLSTLLVSIAVVGILNVDDDTGAQLGPALAETLTADFAAQQRGPMITGLVLALIGLLLGRRPSAVALRSVPKLLWKRDRTGVLNALDTIVGDNAAFARLMVWLTGALVLLSWTRPTLRIVVTVVALTVAAQFLVWLFTADHERARRWRAMVGITNHRGSVDGRPTTPLGTNIILVALVGFLLWPAWSRNLVIVFVGVVGLLLALTEFRGARRIAKEQAWNEFVEEATPSRRGRRTVIAAAAVVAALVGGAALSAQAAESTAAETGCNGHDELCERRIDELTFAGSHNAMSATDLGWDLAMQTGDITTQLDAGVRALLIDTHYWDQRGTVEGGDDAAADFVIEAALADDTPQPGLWLCHGFCALGATELYSALVDINAWLDANPREVLILLVQDEVRTADTFVAFEESGLASRVHNHSPDAPWPTLQSLIDIDERVLVYAENEGAPDSWYQNGYASSFTETPFTFAVRSEFSCAVNRGDDSNPLFLLNHWITSGIPVREAALAVNSADSIRSRVEQCRTERGRNPTILAVDFAETGDLFEVVDELNGVSD